MEIKSLIQSSLFLKWLSAKYLSLPDLERFKTVFLSAKPFTYLEFKNFFQPEKVIEIVKALAEEKWIPQQADLFQFKQTGDLSGTKNKVLQEFRTFLSSKEFVYYLSHITSMTLKPHSIDISGTMYEDTDYLLCHDDQLEGRKIAYFLYLSDVDKNDGGALNLFSSKEGVPAEIAASIIPKFNTFSFFLVSEKSFHEVQEVMRDVQRIAISGWFHEQ